MSNKMPINQPNETKSAPNTAPDSPVKRNPKRLIFAVLITLFGVFIMVSGIIGLTDNKSRLIAPAGTLNIEIVDTPELRTLGLSNRTSLDENSGMLFVFDETKTSNCFWMKDMQFAIDMIWLDAEKKVVTVKENATPETFPESFCPSGPAKYGLEVKAFRAADLEIQTGTTVRF